MVTRDRVDRGIGGSELPQRPDDEKTRAENEYAANQVKALYRPLYLIETPIVITNLETSELIKYAANTMLAITNCGSPWFQLSGISSNARRNSGGSCGKFP